VAVTRDRIGIYSMARPCGCLGGNENCTFCHGSGYLAQSDYLPLSDARKSWGPASRESRPRVPLTPRTVSTVANRAAGQSPGGYAVQVSHPPTFYCPYCAARFGSEARVDAHVDAEHVAGANDTSEQAKTKPFVRIGGRVFERRSLQRAKQPPLALQAKSQSAGAPMVRQNPPESARASASTVSLPANSPLIPQRGGAKRPLVRCPNCPSPVREDRLARHLRNHHGIAQGASTPSMPIKRQSLANGRPPQPDMKATRKAMARTNKRSRALAAGKGYSGPAPDSGDNGLSEIDNYWEERRLDGSRDYWQVREEGRFGSHPSYDDCDDESAP